MADARTVAIKALLTEIWDSRPALRAAQKLFLAASKDPAARAIVPRLRASEVRLWVRDKPRHQAFYRPKQEWPGRDEISSGPGVRLNVDLLDWSEITNATANAGYKYVLLAQDPHTRYAWARATRNKSLDVLRGIREILAEARPLQFKQIVHDKGGEFIAHTWRNLMQDLDIVDRQKGQDILDSRATLQNISIMDSAMGKFAAALKAEAGGTTRRDWHNHVNAAINEINKQEIPATKKSGRGMMSVSPDQAVGADGGG